ncbi:MAG TPA: 50S ribosomal protein L9 [Bacilli bacterium]|jgi:large subunit ribosomal protein L9|nr:50S ribosomal protein L9 [Bacilli bacterium]
MKVILLKDVKNVGKKDQVIEVSDGYASNFLIPRKLAVFFTSKSKEVLENQKEQVLLTEKQNTEAAKKTAEKFEKVYCEFVLSTGEKGRTFGSISAKQIEKQLQDQYGITVDKRKFINFTPINQLGTTIVKIELYKGVIGELKVVVKTKE